MSNLTIAILSFAASIVINVLIDGAIWEAQRNSPSNTRNHKTGWYWKAGLSIPAAYFFLQASNWQWVFNLATTALLMIVWMNFLFDGLYNIYRREPFFWLGTDDKDDPKTDKFWKSMPQWLHISLKLILAFGTAYLYSIGLSK